MIVQLLNLQLSTFAFLYIFLNIENDDGSPVRPIAVLGIEEKL